MNTIIGRKTSPFYLTMYAFKGTILKEIFLFARIKQHCFLDSEYLVYTLHYNLTLVCFVGQIIVTLAVGNSFSWFLCVFNIPPNIVVICVLSTSLLFGTSR